MAEGPEREAAATELVRRSYSAALEPMDRRRLVTETSIGALFLLAATALAVAGDATREWDVVPALVLTLLFAGAIRVQFDVGAGYTSPVELVFVPMLLLLPTPAVPLLVCAGWLLGNLPDVVRRRLHPDRLLLVPANCWFAIGPAVVLTAADAQTPDWSDWPWYLLALASQFVLDLVATEVREWAGRGIPPKLQAQLVGWIQAVDAMLAPLGLLAAFASESWEYAFLLLVPAAGLLVFFSRERSGRLQSALALADAAREREELIAQASHHLVTPVAVVGGLVERLDDDLSPARRAEAHAAMRREMAKLRYRVREFADYARLKADRGLVVDPREVDVVAVAREVAAAFPAVAIENGAAPVRAYVDPARLQQMLMSLVSDAFERSASGAQILIQARHGPGTTEISVGASGASAGATSGIGLPLARELARACGGDINVTAGPGDAVRLTLVLPADG